MKVCLTIAGIDPSGGAGVYADIKTFSAFGCYGAAVITSITFQNTQRVFGAENQTAECVRKQILPILDDFNVSALKTGMLPTSEIIEETARIVAENKLPNLVVDPVVRSTSGFDLIDDKALKSLIENLFPLSDIITPNIPEAERITGMKIKNVADIEKAARLMQSFGAKNVLIKGGHFAEEEGRTKTAKDFLFIGRELHIFGVEFIATKATHGTGCTLAAAIAANLATGRNLLEAVDSAKKFVTEAIRTAPHLGKGHSPINHLAWSNRTKNFRQKKI